jgi:hypothetical protein
VNGMKALVSFKEKELIKRDELLPLLAVQMQHRSKSVRKKAKVFIEIVRTT